MRVNRTDPEMRERIWRGNPTCVLCGQLITQATDARIAPPRYGERVAHKTCARAWEP